MSTMQFSVYIPRIFNNVPNDKIISTFENLELGKVSNLDIVYKTGVDGSTYKMAFVHFSSWCRNPAADNFRDKIEDPSVEAKLVYDDPWYWIVLPNNSTIKKESCSSYQVPLEQALSSYINLNECFNRINHIEEEVGRVYEELFGRELIPSSKHINQQTFGDIESGDITPMSISDLDCDDVHRPLHLPQHNGNSSTESPYYYDEVMSISSSGDNFYDVELGGPTDCYDNNFNDRKYDRRWVTDNICGNS